MTITKMFRNNHSIIIAIQYVAATNTSMIHQELAVLKIQEKNCPPLFHCDNGMEQCECLSSLFD
jgi:hypothetical protein